MLIGSRKRIRGKNIDLFIDNRKLNQVTVCKYLGVYIDNSLDWDEHVNNLCKITVKNLYFIAKKLHYFFKSQLLKVNRFIVMFFGIIQGNKIFKNY